MKSRLLYNREQPRPSSSRYSTLASFFAVALILGCAPRASAGSDAPAWMHSLVSAPLPTRDEKTDAVLLYSEENVTVLSTDKIKRQVRAAYKILRPGGRRYGTVYVVFHAPGEKVTSLHGWCIPAQGKDFEVKDKDAMEVAPSQADGAELITDVRAKRLQIPASDPGNIVGYEYEKEERPLVLQDEWYFQGISPVRESHYSLQLPSSWEYRAFWLNYSEVKPAQGGSNQWQWAVNDVKGLREEEDMPPAEGIEGMMVVSFFPPGGPSVANGYSTWRDMGSWYQTLESGRTNASPEIKQEVATLTASANSQLAKMQALAKFVQHDIRYVAIELGIGGYQPHAAADIFTHRYGDCKDKATLMRSMLHEIGVETYPVIINTERGSITANTPAYQGFNHQIIALKLPAGLNDPSLIATLIHPKLGRILFFDPTSELTPFGQIRGHLQANWGLLVTPDGGELVQLPEQPSAMNGIQRNGKLSLDPTGTLKGEVKEVRLGDRAFEQRWAQRTVSKDAERIKPIENLLANSLSNFQITKAEVINMTSTDKPFGFDYTFQAESYAKNAGGLLLVRPRVLGSKAQSTLETKEPRKFAIEFPGPVRDTDTFEITLPPGYEVEDLPPPVDADYEFASYHSKSEATGNIIRYQRTFEVKELSVPVSKADDLKKFYRIIASDERNTAVLRPKQP